VRDVDGRVIHEQEPEGRTAGLHRATWNLRQDPPRGSARGGTGGRGGRGFGGFGGGVRPGTYRIELEVNEDTYSQRLEVIADPMDGS
jgi:hypothetical protein